MRVYGGNYNGKNRAIVAAKSKAEAARLIGISMYEFGKFYCETANATEIGAAMAAPNTVFLQSMRANAPIIQRNEK